MNDTADISEFWWRCKDYCYNELISNTQVRKDKLPAWFHIRGRTRTIKYFYTQTLDDMKCAEYFPSNELKDRDELPKVYLRFT
jgi:hypothetical protein